MNKRLQILVLDDDANQANLLVETLQRMGHVAQASTKAREALELVRQQSPHLVITDLRMPEMDGLAFLKAVKETDPDVEVLLITAYASVSSAVAAIRLGALDYLEKPVEIPMLSAKIASIQTRVGLRAENRTLRTQLDTVLSGRTPIGESDAFKRVLAQLDRAAESDAPVLLQGESGTGKEILARRLHERGKRATGPFIPINCSAIPENLVESEFFGHVKGAFTGADHPRPGRIEDAEGGTLFLDEIGELPLSLQPKLLRVIQDGEFTRLGSNKRQRADVRWVAATNRDLSQMIREGAFREDLYYRLAVLPMTIPPLRERRDDIPLLLRSIMAIKSRAYKTPERLFTPEALALLSSYRWPGNIRELENVLERLILLVPGDTIDVQDLPREIGEIYETPANLPRGRLEERVAALERQCPIEALQTSRGNQSEAARNLGIHERTLRYKIRKLGIPFATEC